LALALLVTVGGPLTAQMIPGLGVYGGGMMLRVRSNAAGFSESMQNEVWVGEAVYTRGMLVADGLYAEGRLTPTGGTPRDLVEARGFAGLRVFHILSIKAGPQIRATALPGGTRRRVLWEMRSRVESPINDVLGAYAEGWAAVAGRSNVAEHIDRAHGAEAALTAHFARWPVWAKLGYRVEHAEFDGGLRSETIDGIALSVGFGWWSR
jgi:hypothetical protein